jgi:hypothetical protein
MSSAPRPALPHAPLETEPPTLDALTRERLGRHLQALYEPIIDETLDPRLAALLGQLDQDRQSDQT